MTPTQSITTVKLTEGDIEVHVAGPANSARPPVVFVHGFLVNATLWSKVAALLAARGIRSYAPDLPLGSHRVPLADGADRSPRGIARLVVHLLESLDLHDVTLVGNDTGGALCQFVLDEDASRIGRLVLTNCDTPGHFPPGAFKTVFWAARSAKRMKLFLAPTRLRLIRHSPTAYGLLMRRPRDPALTKGWVTPALSDLRICEDAAAFARGVSNDDLADVSSRLHHFAKPVRMVWGAADRYFTLAEARKLATTFGGDAVVIEIAGGKTFVSVDHPDEVAAAIAELALSEPLDPVSELRA